MRILLCGNRSGTNIGGALERCAIQQGHEVSVLEPELANSRFPLVQRFNWWLRGRRPAKLDWFDRLLLNSVEAEKPDVVLSVGISPPGESAAKRLAARRVRLINYLTDDPWQRRLRADWFIRALPSYDAVFSTKREIMSDLRRAGVKHTIFLPFAYDPGLHFRCDRDSHAAGNNLDSDILFAGGGDSDRYPFLRALVDLGLRVAIYGEQWSQEPMLRDSWRGHANPAQLRKATAAAKLCLCLVRRANRDGHVMRSFEIAAMHGCLLMEDTQEHRELFGEDRESVAYFRNVDEMVMKAKMLLSDPKERERLADAAHNRICRGHHTYGDRLITMVTI